MNKEVFELNEIKTNGFLPKTNSEPKLDYLPEDKVMSCSKIESGLRLGNEAIRACCMGAIVSPMFWSAEEAGKLQITKEMIISKRKWLFKYLNSDEGGNLSCRRCEFVEQKKFKDIKFNRINHLNVAHFSSCNLRCNFCGFTQTDTFHKEKYEALPILREFNSKDVEWNSFVDLNGGEPTLLKNLKEYFDYFNNRGIRILLYSNGVLYRDEIYEYLKNGGIMWLNISIDAGTPSTFRNTKGSDKYINVLENLTKYAEAGSGNGGRLAVKYIFTDDNCGDDDISGFVYSMLAIKPQKIWLTFDFSIINNYEKINEISDRYKLHVNAYAKTYLLFKKHGIEIGHFEKSHLAVVLVQGQSLLDLVEMEIKRLMPKYDVNNKSLIIGNYRNKETSNNSIKFQNIKINPLSIQNNDTYEPLNLTNKNILLVPACSYSKNLLENYDLKNNNILGFVDRDKSLHNKTIKNLKIINYHNINDCNPDYIIIAAPEQHEEEIIKDISENNKSNAKILLVKNNNKYDKRD